ncbi:MAG: DsbA family oxidoreductase [Parvularculales bacterium]
MDIDVLSDTICPWCYIGKKRLQRAAAERESLDLQIFWRPFQLDPTLPPEGIDRKTYMKRKFGDRDMRGAYEALREAGDQEGIDFAFEDIKRTPNTFDSHRLIRWAGSAGCQDKVVDLLFEAYFEQGRDIGTADVLVEIAGDTDMDASLVKDLLDTDADRDLIAREMTLAHQMGVQGVPYFIADHKSAIVGAQESDVLVKLMDHAAQDSSPS